MLTAAPALTVRIEQLVAKLSSGVPGWPVKLATGINNPSIAGAGYIDPSSEGPVEETVPPAPADPDLQQPEPVATPAVAVIATTVGSVTRCLHFPKRVLRYPALRRGSPYHSEQHQNTFLNWVAARGARPCCLHSPHISRTWPSHMRLFVVCFAGWG